MQTFATLTEVTLLSLVLALAFAYLLFIYQGNLRFHLKKKSAIII